MRNNNIIPLQSPLTIASTRKIEQKIIKNKIAVPTKDGRLILSVGKIYYIHADSNYSELFDTNGKRYLVTKTLKFIEAQLPHKQFFRCHQSYLINVDFISEIRRDQKLVLLVDELEKIVPLSRRQSAQLKKMFHFF